jgi:hypothetical protein
VKGKGSLLAIVAPSSKGAPKDDDDAPDDGSDDNTKETKIDAAQALIEAIGNKDPEAVSKAFDNLCELNAGM